MLEILNFNIPLLKNFIEEQSFEYFNQDDVSDIKINYENNDMCEKFYISFFYKRSEYFYWQYNIIDQYLYDDDGNLRISEEGKQIMKDIYNNIKKKEYDSGDLEDYYNGEFVDEN
jgi:hypothetical protein